MEKKLCELDVDTLKSMYEKKTSDLERALLNGAVWEDLKDQRQEVTELAIALHKQIMGSDHPAGVSGREGPRERV